MATTALTGLPHSVGAQFQAKFDSNCKGCDLAVYEGDLMGYVDDVAVCDGCYNDADQANHLATRAMAEAQRERDRAEDPERFARTESAVNAWMDKVRAKAAEHPGKEWVPAPDGIAGYARNPDYEPRKETVCTSCHLVKPCDCEPSTEPAQEAPVTTETIEPGIQALMAAGLLQGQEPGGTGVCNATITDGSGKVTEVAIPVPLAPPAPPEVPSAGTAGDPGAEAPVIMTTPGPDLPSVASRALEAEARKAQLADNTADWDPAAIAADVKATQLQAGLQSAVDAGAMTLEQAAALGWVGPPSAAVQMAQDDAAMAEMARQDEARSLADSPIAHVAPPTGLVLGALSAATTPAEEDAILEALDSLPAYVGGFNHDAAKKEILGILQEAINYHPRSLQKKIGPSEIGTECDHCLAAKLAGWEQVDRDAWLPTVGTAVHSWIESAFGRIHSGPGGTRRFLTERKVSVGEIDGVEITGSTDLVDVALGCTWDWKIVGPTTLKAAKAGPSRRYVVQQQLYGRGWNRLGVKVTRVGIAYLPRNAMSLSAGVWWSADYDESIAVEALERASGFARNIRALESLGKDAVDAYVSGLPRWRSWRDESGKLVEGNALEGKIVCLDCPRYSSDYPSDPADALKQLDGLMV